jgi:hypothetical protein
VLLFLTDRKRWRPTLSYDREMERAKGSTQARIARVSAGRGLLASGTATAWAACRPSGAAVAEDAIVRS